MTALEFNDFITHSENEVDAYIDSRTKEVARMQAGERVIFDSRLAWYFVPESFKTYLTVSPEIAARRVFEGRKEEVERYSSEVEAYRQLSERKALEDMRFKNLYGVDCNDLNNYHLILDTGNLSPDEVAKKLFEECEAYYSK
jgi:cytidylate kinase